MRIEEFMTIRIEHVDAESSVYEAIEKMADRRIRSLVVRYPDGKDYGVITARDIIYRVLAEKKDPSRVEVSEIASRPIVCVKRETDFLEVAQMMKQNNIARVFVCDEKGIAGVVALLDVMNATLIMRARGEDGS
jgi:signal-transduction protein with cAMP-binding, CBS, and nucleotidyltransferase domain